MGSHQARHRLNQAVGASADGLVAHQPGEPTGSRPQPPKAGARSASLEPGRSPGYLPTTQLLDSDSSNRLHLATIDVEHDAGHETGAGRGEEDDRGGKFARLAEALEQRHVGQAAFSFAR
jgi:hypothetical protein